MTKLKILGVHGLGDQRNHPWADEWREAILPSFPITDAERPEFIPLTYDDIFAKIDLSAWQTASAVAKLTASGIGSLFERKSRGFFDTASHWLKWYAGYVVAWVESNEFKKKTRRKVLDALRKHQPDVLLGHSLGSLVTYNALSHPDAAADKIVAGVMRKLTYVTFGSQLGNPFVVKNLTPGRLAKLPVRRWFHLYNEEDAVFTAQIRLWDAANFEQVETFFDIEGWADHDARNYLSHPATADQVWRPFVKETSRTAPRGAARVLPSARALKKPPTKQRLPRRRAILIGINDYPDEAARLDGCVNDVFLMSSVLQECKFEPEQIRVCLNDRATAKGILERMKWLLENPIPGDELVFFFSGHGAQLPTYGDADVVDRMDESLVPYDFDWTPEHCVTDDQIFALYSQLPFDTRLLMIFDCCHSGGIHRAGSHKVRGLNPPDDIRHRGMKWNHDLEMWEERDLKAINNQFSTNKEVMREFCGTNGSTYRLGRAMTLRQQTEKEYKQMRVQEGGKQAPPIGPFLPVIIEACQEAEFSYEYRDGVTSYGAFTYTLAKTLRQKKKVTFEKLVDIARERLTHLGFDQRPQILGPKAVLKANVPWMT